MPKLTELEKAWFRVVSPVDEGEDLLTQLANLQKSLENENSEKDQ